MTFSETGRFTAMPRRLAAFVAAGLCVWATAGAWAADATNKSQLTVERIFTTGEFGSQGYGSIEWGPNGTAYYKWESAKEGGGRDLVRIDSATGNREILVPSQALIPPGESGLFGVSSHAFSTDRSKLLLFTNTKRVWRQHNRGDYWVLDISSRELKKLGGNAEPSSLQFAKFSPDGHRVAYVRERNIYVEDLREKTIIALTTDGSTNVINGTFDWVYEEELDLRDGFRWSPDGESIAFWQIDTSGVGVFFLLNQTDSLYARTISFPYPKAGEKNSAARMGVVSVNGGEPRWLNIPGDPREHYLARMDWATDSKTLMLQQFNRLQNTNRVILADPITGDTHTILVETDDAWVDNNNPTRWLADGREFLWLSERSGWRHAYRVSQDGKRIRPITRGPFDLISVESIDEKNGWLYFIASPKNPTQRYLYRARLKGGKAERLTPENQPGTHDYQISPDSQWALHSYSSFTNPPITELIWLPGHESVRVLETNQKLRDKLATLQRPGTEFFRVDISPDVTLDGWCLTPPDFDPAKKYPVLFYVYGEPGGQTVMDQWRDRGGYWHWMLAQQGYIVMSVDNRGTPAPRGRDWRKIIYRQVGILNSADQAAAVRTLLRERPYLDAKRVGVWGWSGGGSSTLNAILQYPELYHTGIAVAAVPNQRYYDTIYQERYMGLPKDNSEGYRKGSPVTYASQLRGNLLIVHGTGDDNVHYQGVEALINELVRYNKPFTMMAYPNRSHGISEGHNTVRHFYELLTRYLNQNLPPGPVSDDAG